MAPTNSHRLRTVDVDHHTGLQTGDVIETPTGDRLTIDAIAERLNGADRFDVAEVDSRGYSHRSYDLQRALDAGSTVLRPLSTDADTDAGVSA